MKTARRGAGRVAFLAHLEAIRQEIGAGWTMQAVYDNHGPKLGITYSQFVRYVARFVKERPAAKQTHRPDLSNDKATIQPTPSPEVFETAFKPKRHPLFEPTPPSDQELF